MVQGDAFFPQLVHVRHHNHFTNFPELTITRQESSVSMVGKPGVQSVAVFTLSRRVAVSIDSRAFIAMSSAGLRLMGSATLHLPWRYSHLKG